MFAWICSIFSQSETSIMCVCVLKYCICLQTNSIGGGKSGKEPFVSRQSCWLHMTLWFLSLRPELNQWLLILQIYPLIWNKSASFWLDPKMCVIKKTNIICIMARSNHRSEISCNWGLQTVKWSPLLILWSFASL